MRNLLFQIVLIFFCIGAANAESLKIGLIAPLTGTGSALGQYVKKGTELSVTKAKENGVEIDLFVEDDNWDAPKSISIAQRFISLKR